MEFELEVPDADMERMIEAAGRDVVVVCGHPGVELMQTLFYIESVCLGEEHVTPDNMAERLAAFTAEAMGWDGDRDPWAVFPCRTDDLVDFLRGMPPDEVPEEYKMEQYEGKHHPPYGGAHRDMEEIAVAPAAGHFKAFIILRLAGYDEDEFYSQAMDLPLK